MRRPRIGGHLLVLLSVRGRRGRSRRGRRRTGLYRGMLKGGGLVLTKLTMPTIWLLVFVNELG